MLANLFIEIQSHCLSLSFFGFGLITKLDFVHLSGITDGVNQALKNIRGYFNHLVFLVDL